MIYVHLAEGFEEIEAVTIIDVLRRAELETESVSVTGSKWVKGAHGITVEADILYEEAEYENCDMIVLPGGIPGTPNLGAHEGLLARIKDFAGRGQHVAAICAAPMVLGKAGVLDGKKATIYPGMEEHLTGAKPLGDRVVRDGNIITSQSAGTAMAFAIALAEVFKGKEMAARLKKSMLVR